MAKSSPVYAGLLFIVYEGMFAANRTSIILVFTHFFDLTQRVFLRKGDI